MNWTFLSLACALLATSAAAQDTRYEQVGDQWYRQDARGRFRVDPEVISVRFVEGVGNYAEFSRRVMRDPVLLTGMEVVRKNRLGTFDLRIPEGSDPLRVLAALRRTGLVEVCEENVFGSFLEIPNDPFFAMQNNLRSLGLSGATRDADVDAEQAWNFTTGLDSIVVAVLDSGCQINHEELMGSIWTNPVEIPGNGIDEDLNGFVDDVNGWNFELDNSDLSDSISHGTGVAGVIGARANNGIGIAGLAGGFGERPGVTLLPIKLATAVISTAIVDDAILYAVDQGAHVINMSFQVQPTAAINVALEDARDTHGVLLVAASGNTRAAVDYPARHPKVLAVPGTNRDDEHWAPSGLTGSNVGPENWVAASSDAVWTTAVNDNILGLSGTSFAAPQVAATAALMLSILPSLTPEDIQEILKLTAEDVDVPGFDERTGWGRLNAYSAVLHVASSDCNENGIYDAHEILDGTAQDVDGDGVPDDCDFTAFCFGNGDGAACAPCPCGNAAPKGARAGCENASGTSCALLARGTPSLAVDTLSFTIEGAQPNSLAVLCSADAALPKNGPCAAGAGIASPLLDGLRCIGGSFRRHGMRSTDANGSGSHWGASSGPVGGLAQDGGFLAGQERMFQVFYLDGTGAGCGSGRNTSNAVRVSFRP